MAILETMTNDDIQKLKTVMYPAIKWAAKNSWAVEEKKAYSVHDYLQEIARTSADKKVYIAFISIICDHYMEFSNDVTDKEKSAFYDVLDLGSPYRNGTILNAISKLLNKNHYGYNALLKPELV